MTKNQTVFEIGDYVFWGGRIVRIMSNFFWEKRAIDVNVFGDFHCIKIKPLFDGKIRKIVVDDLQVKKATVLDFIRTLDIDRMVRLLYRGNGCGSICVYKDEDCVRECGYGICKTGIKSWLEQPLTDDLVKELDGGE